MAKMKDGLLFIFFLVASHACTAKILSSALKLEHTIYHSELIVLAEVLSISPEAPLRFAQVKIYDVLKGTPTETLVNVNFYGDNPEEIQTSVYHELRYLQFKPGEKSILFLKKLRKGYGVMSLNHGKLLIDDVNVTKRVLIPRLYIKNNGFKLYEPIDEIIEFIKTKIEIRKNDEFKQNCMWIGTVSY